MMAEGSNQQGSHGNGVAMRQQARIAERNRSDVRLVDLEGKVFRVSPTVYIPSGDTLLLVHHVHGDENGTFLDVGCGCGAAAVHLSCRFRTGLAVDVNHAAVEDSVFNLETYKIKNVSVEWSNVFSAVSGRWDVICFNGPYDDCPCGDPASAMFWDPNHRSKVRFFKELPLYLNDDGRVFYGAAEYAPTDMDAAAALFTAAKLSVVNKYSTPGKGGNFDYVLYELANAPTPSS